ncbi:MAG: hypothetical protein A3K19_00330 [Lentisphaerae bacterium RIFOXYB12_FULL_65_16]|nr:MAG: hypothetical protein A3K18_00400 [Lentisphaerae bacterium RIFOXYA12_64_32]OGV85368.1 MAG: hypothetical protein A3K19_00330 [Lentisphaerae bacterium RIFOXYB12_FULL_65_16]
MKRILIVEDNAVISSIYADMYRLAGFEVEVAEDGEVGLRKLAEFKPDLIQLDLQMPKVDGVEVIRRLRAQPQWAHLPILVLSTAYVSDVVTGALQSGATQCLSKANCAPKNVIEAARKLLAAHARPAPVSVTADATQVQQGPTPGAMPQQSETSVADDGGRGASETDVRRPFVVHASEIQRELLNRLSALVAPGATAPREEALAQLRRTVGWLTGHAATSGFVRISHLAGALEVLLNEMVRNPQKVTPSSLRTVSQAIHTLVVLCEEAAEQRAEELESVLVLAVDDDPVSRRVLASSLADAGLRTLCLEDADVALAVLKDNPVDLVLLDVDMPGMDGFELCRRVRSFATNRRTPVIFVTGMTDTETRVGSAWNGGTDFIAKPFVPTEMAVKALALLLNPRRTSAVKDLAHDNGRLAA